MEYTAQFTYDCLWRVDGEKRGCMRQMVTRELG